MKLAHGFANLGKRIPESDIAIGDVPDRQYRGHLRMKFPVQQRAENQNDGNESPAAHNPPNHFLSISESNPNGSRRANHASHWIDKAYFTHRLIECYRLDLAGSQANHS